MTSFTRKEKMIAVGIGMAFMILALIVQGLVQSIPVIYFILKYGISKGLNFVMNFDVENYIFYSIFIGAVAAIFQEGFKLVSVDTRPSKLAIWIGLGFSLIDIVFLYGESLPHLVNGISIFIVTGIIFNTFSSLIFHPGTAMMLKYGLLAKRKFFYLVIAIIFHGIIDSGVVLSDFIILRHLSSFDIIFALFWTVAITISVIAFSWGVILMNRLKNNNSTL